MVFFANKITVWVTLRDAAFFAACYVAGAMFMPRDLFLEALNGMLAALCACVCIVYFPSVVRLWKFGASGILLLRVGVVVAWSDQMFQAAARVYFIEFRPEVQGRTFDALIGMPAIGYIIGAALHLVAIGMVGNDLPRRNVCWVSWSLIGGGAVVVALRGARLLIAAGV